MRGRGSDGIDQACCGHKIALIAILLLTSLEIEHRLVLVDTRGCSLASPLSSVRERALPYSGNRPSRGMIPFFRRRQHSLKD